MEPQTWNRSSAQSACAAVEKALSGLTECEGGVKPLERMARQGIKAPKQKWLVEVGRVSELLWPSKPKASAEDGSSTACKKHLKQLAAESDALKACQGWVKTPPSFWLNPPFDQWIRFQEAAWASVASPFSLPQWRPDLRKFRRDGDNVARTVRSLDSRFPCASVESLFDATCAVGEGLCDLVSHFGGIEKLKQDLEQALLIESAIGKETSDRQGIVCRNTDSLQVERSARPSQDNNPVDNRNHEVQDLLDELSKELGTQYEEACDTSSASRPESIAKMLLNISTDVQAGPILFRASEFVRGRQEGWKEDESPIDAVTALGGKLGIYQVLTIPNRPTDLPHGGPIHVKDQTTADPDDDLSGTRGNYEEINQSALTPDNSIPLLSLAYPPIVDAASVRTALNAREADAVRGRTVPPASVSRSSSVSRAYSLRNWMMCDPEQVQRIEAWMEDAATQLQGSVADGHSIQEAATQRSPRGIKRSRSASTEYDRHLVQTSDSRKGSIRADSEQGDVADDRAS